MLDFRENKQKKNMAILNLDDGNLIIPPIVNKGEEKKKT